MTTRQALTRALSDHGEPNFLDNRDEMMRLLREGVQRELAEQRAAGYTIYYGGTGDDAHKLFMHTPDGRRFEYRVREDGTREIVREIAE